MISFLRFYARWRAFFHPVAGWRQRYNEYRAGRTVWPGPVHPLVPWPLEWFPHRFTNLETEQDKANGFAFETVICTDSGQVANPGQAVSCLRCGVPLHHGMSGALNSVDPVKCRRCTWVLRFLG